MFLFRSAVLGCYLTEQLFLESDGVFHLLDLLEVVVIVSVAARNVFLRMRRNRCQKCLTAISMLISSSDLSAHNAKSVVGLFNGSL